MASPAFNSDQMDALARILAAAALDELMSEMVADVEDIKHELVPDTAAQVRAAERETALWNPRGYSPEPRLPTGPRG